MTTPTANSATTAQKGLEGVIAADTRVGDVDGVKCELIYRGYTIDELVGRATYEETAYLLLFGELPTGQEFKEWQAQLAAHRALAPDILNFMQTIPTDVNPMAMLRTVVSLIALYDTRADDESIPAVRQKAIRVIAKMPTIVAVFDRLRRKEPIVPPREDLGHTANLLYMLHGQAANELDARALDTYFTLHADHGFNASTFAARTTVGTLSDFYSAVVTAIGTLKGDLHGSANRRAMEMLQEIGSPERIGAFVQDTLTAKNRFMGFGHRVYKGEDPRAKHLKAMARSLGEAKHELKWFTISERLQQAVWEAKQLYINVDFYSASLLYYVGIPVDCFTTMFACSRSAGWSAHILEQYADNRLIRPLSQFVGPRNLKYAPIDQRRRTG
ncbi:MAG: citrate synthase [Candidatus Omnitrophica bacterium]|nr:citrate synthase [Candidatus Omnitrophota bacterium]